MPDFFSKNLDLQNESLDKKNDSDLDALAQSLEQFEEEIISLHSEDESFAANLDSFDSSLNGPDSKTHEKPTETAEPDVKPTHNDDTSYTDYSRSVNRLMNIAINDKGAEGHAAAQFMLSAYNGKEWHFGVTDLDNLNYEDVVHVIRGRQLYSTDPHCVVDNGQTKIYEIQDVWPNLKSSIRFANQD
mgnify:CR=1 FL=1